MKRRTRKSDTACPPGWSLEAVEAGLSKTTEVFAHELARPSTSAPDWSEPEWLLARATASIHGVSSLLSGNLRWRGPEGWARFLAEQRAHTLIRHTRICDLLAAIDARMRTAGVSTIALKGAALHAIGLYAAGERPMADTDLLVQPPDLERAIQILEGLGFHQTYATWKDRTFEPSDAFTPGRLGENSDNPIKIELHDRVGDILPLRPIDISECLFASDPLPGVNLYPSTASLMLHLLLHAAGAMASRSLRLINLHDIAVLCTRMTANDWQDIMRLAEVAGGPWWVFPPLALTARYYTSLIPPWTLAAFAPDCPRPLRKAVCRQTLSDLSFSHLWIGAFPGIRWARSFREALEYVAQRIVPGAEALRTRKQFVNTQPYLAESEWGHLSQAMRILRWLRSRPPRPGTMRVVREALKQQPEQST